jgi:hypothetical protein
MEMEVLSKGSARDPFYAVQLSTAAKAIGGSFESAPRYEAVSCELHTRLELIAISLAGLRIDQIQHSIALIVEATEVSNSEPWASVQLRHYLSDKFIARQLSEGRDLMLEARRQLKDAARCANERNAFSVDQRLLLQRFLQEGNVAHFLELIECTASMATGNIQKLRMTGVRLGTDNNGQFWAFPSALVVRPSCKKLASDILDAYQYSPLYAAIICLVGINSIHPLCDGNGRTSRVLFNLLLHEGNLIPATCSIPLKHIYYHSYFGFELRLRQAILVNDHAPLIDYFCNALSCLIGLANNAPIRPVGNYV